MSLEATSLIAPGTTVTGGVSAKSDLHVEGLIHGDVAVAHLFIGEGGQVEGAIQADFVETHGRVVGSIAAKQVKLFAGCVVEGDVTHEVLTMEPGAVFQGRSLRLQRPKPALVGPTERLEADAVQAAS